MLLVLLSLANANVADLAAAGDWASVAGALSWGTPTEGEEQAKPLHFPVVVRGDLALTLSHLHSLELVAYEDELLGQIRVEGGWEPALGLDVSCIGPKGRPVRDTVGIHSFKLGPRAKGGLVRISGMKECWEAGGTELVLAMAGDRWNAGAALYHDDVGWWTHEHGIKGLHLTRKDYTVRWSEGNVGTLLVEGADPDAIDAALNARLQAMEVCYAHARDETKGAQGILAFEATAGPEGLTTLHLIASGVPEADLCVQDALLEGPWAGVEGEVTFILGFKPDGLY